jgi:hypothetical protein
VVLWWEKSTAVGLVTPFIALTSIGSWIKILISLGIFVVTILATSRIITQAGYSRYWILLPLSPFVLTTICYIILWNDFHAIFFGGVSVGFGTEGLFWHLDEISILLNWLFYLLFAFNRWPVTGTRHASDVDVPHSPRATRATSRPTPTPPAAAAAPPTARVSSASAASPGAPPASVSETPAKRPGALHCAWCGESLPGNRALFHDCGTKDRPETFCKNCGTALAEGSSECAVCASN